MIGRPEVITNSAGGDLVHPACGVSRDRPVARLVRRGAKRAAQVLLPPLFLLIVACGSWPEPNPGSPPVPVTPTPPAPFPPIEPVEPPEPVPGAPEAPAGVVVGASFAAVHHAFGRSPEYGPEVNPWEPRVLGWRTSDPNGFWMVAFDDSGTATRVEWTRLIVTREGP